jgi:hypothetical protein
MVGEAYVRVTADTTQMRRALHRAARDSERDMQAFQALIDDVADSQISAVKKRLAGGLVDPKILTRWSKEFKNSSEAAENFRGVINSIRNDFSEMTAKQQKEHLAAINRWEKQAKAAESLAAAEKQRLADEKAALDAAKVRSAEQQRMLVAQQKFAEEGRRQLAKIALAEEKEVAARQQRMAAAQERFVAEARRVQQIELRDAIVHADRMNKAFDSIAEKYSLVFRKKSDGFIFKRSELTSLAAQFEHAGETAGEALARGVRSRVRSIEGAFDSIALRINRSGGFVGTILGKGSRNNFLNFFGSAIGGLVNILSVPFTLMSKLASGVSQLAEGFKVLRLGGASSMEALSALAARAAPAAAAGLAVLGVAIAAAAVAIPALVSGLWLLIGALTALVGSISIGIIGGLLALGPAIVGLAAGLGAAVLVFRRMGEDGTKAAASLSRIKKAFADLGDSASEESDRVASQIEGTIVPAINGAKPVMRSLVTAFGEVMADLGRKVQNSEFQQRLAEWGQSLPRLFTDMGGAFNSLGTGLVSFFAGVLPVAERFASSFNGLMERFREWATSLEGQNQIKTWMDQAWTAANNLWGIISNLAGAIGKIFTSGDANAGNDMLDTLSRKAEEFNKWLGSPDGKEKMKQFFSDARELADKLWEIIKNVGETLKNLDTDQAREDFLTIVEGAKKMAEAIKTLSRAVEVLGKTLFPVKTLIDAIAGGGSSKSKSSSTPSLDTKFPASDSWSKLTGGGPSQADEKEQQRRLDAMAAAVEKSQERVRAAFRQTERDTQNSTPGPKAEWYEQSKAAITSWSEHFGGVSSKTSTSMVETIGTWTQDTLAKIDRVVQHWWAEGCRVVHWRGDRGERREESPEGDLRRHPHRCHHVSGRTPAGRREPVHIGPDAGSDPSLPFAVQRQFGTRAQRSRCNRGSGRPAYSHRESVHAGVRPRAGGARTVPPSDSVEFVRCPRRGRKSPVWTRRSDWRRIQCGLRHRDEMAGEHSGCRQFHAQSLQPSVEHRPVHRWRPDGLRHWWRRLRPHSRPDRRSRSRDGGAVDAAPVTDLSCRAGSRSLRPRQDGNGKRWDRWCAQHCHPARRYRGQQSECEPGTRGRVRA